MNTLIEYVRTILTNLADRILALVDHARGIKRPIDGECTRHPTLKLLK